MEYVNKVRIREACRPDELDTNASSLEEIAVKTGFVFHVHIQPELWPFSAALRHMPGGKARGEERRHPLLERVLSGQYMDKKTKYFDDFFGQKALL